MLLKTKKVAFNIKNLENLFIVYKLDAWSPELNTASTLKDCLLPILDMVLRLILVDFFKSETRMVKMLQQFISAYL